MSKVFFDTNILLYAHDEADVRKQRGAIELLREHGLTSVISTQVMQEFFVAATRKLRLEPLVAKDALALYERLHVVTIQPAFVARAIDCSILDRIHFWDALIVVAAESAKCSILFTEGLNDGQLVRGVRIRNPFS